MKKRTLIMMACVVMAAVLSIGGTLAYLTDVDTKVNTFVVGNVDIEVEEDFEDGAELAPGVEVNKDAEIVNNGANDAWVWMTVAVPAEVDEYIELVWADGVTPEGPETKTGDDGNEYAVYTVKVEDEALAPDESTGKLLDAVVLDEFVDVRDGEFIHVENGVETVIDYDLSTLDVIVTGYAIQTNGFDTFDEAYDAYGTQWGDTLPTEETELTGTPVSTDEELAEALAEDKAQIVIELEADVTYDVAAWANNLMGGESTKKIIIIGNGHTLTFNHTNSDWNNVVTTNDATLVLQDLHLTNSGRNDGPWNRHDINFNCPVQLVDVTSDKAIALSHDAKLKNVTITEAGAVYGLWIRAMGQKVTADGLTITSERAIKIADEYIDAPEKVTLKLTDCEFHTTKKAAVLVTSPEGADITLENVDISDCAADTTNAVWCDGDCAEGMSNITVTGGTAAMEP